MRGALVLAAVLGAATCQPLNVPNVPLHNAAAPGTVMPAMGLGTGGYGSNPLVGYGGYPECWMEIVGCGSSTVKAVTAYVKLAASGGAFPIRLDNANNYDTATSVGQVMANSGVPRSNFFLTSKVAGNPLSLPLGYQDILDQIAEDLTTTNVTYFDLVLIHWPTSTGASKDPVCNAGSQYNATACRLDSWRGMLAAQQAGQARAVGVANYDRSQLEEIATAGLPLPAVNQIPIHLFRSSTQQDTIAYCQANGITVNSYSPLGIPDWHAYPTNGTGLTATTLEDPVALSIAQSHNRTAAQVIINWLWQQGIVTNPRTMSPAHMLENLGAYDFNLTASEVTQLSSRPQDWCSIDPTFYECAPASAEL